MLTVAVHFCLRNTTGTHPLQPLQLQKRGKQNKIRPIAFPRSYKNSWSFFSIREMQMSYF